MSVGVYASSEVSNLETGSLTHTAFTSGLERRYFPGSTEKGHSPLPSSLASAYFTSHHFSAADWILRNGSRSKCGITTCKSSRQPDGRWNLSGSQNQNQEFAKGLCLLSPSLLRTLSFEFNVRHTSVWQALATL